MAHPQSCDIAVIGGGLAGLSAAVRAASGGAAVVCFEATPIYGGLIANVGRVDDYAAPGAIAGVTLADQLATRARELGVVFVNAEVTGIESATGGVSITAGPSKTNCRSAIIASGARLRRLGVPGEAEFAGRGVSQCDWCDGGLYRNQRVAVVGGGDAACQAALHLAEVCESVTLIVRGSSLSARRAYVLRAADHPKIDFRWETRVERIVGASGVDALLLVNLADGSPQTEPFAGVFIFAGVVPNLEFAPDALTRDDAGYVVTDAQYRASMPEVFVVGAARSGNGGSLLAAMGEATAAAALAVASLD